MDLQQIARNDQAATELNDIIGRVCAAYKMLTSAGVPEERAAEMAAEYNRRVLNRHFGVQMLTMGTAYLDMGDDDDV